MKKLYSLLLAVLLTSFFTTASAKQFTVNIAHAEHIGSVQVNYEEVEFVEGDNVYDIDMSGAATLIIITNPGCLLDKITDNLGNEVYHYGSQAYIYASSDDAVTGYNITSYSLEEARTATATIKCDAPEKVEIRTSLTNETIRLTSTEQELKFIPGKESPIQIGSTNYQVPLYAVSVNGTPLTSSYGTFEAEIADGDVVEIQANFPDIDCTVTIDDTNGKGFINSVTANGEEVADFSSFTVKAGQQIVLKGNTSDYNFQRLVVNGENVTYFYESYPYTVTGDTHIEVYAAPYSTFDFTIEVDDPDNVIVYRGYDQSNRLSLKAGVNTVSFSENGSTLFNIKASDGGILNKVMCNGSDVTANTNGYYAAAGDVYVITTSKFVRDQHAVVYVNGAGQVPYLNLERANRSQITLKDGYNEVDLDASDNPFGLSFFTNNNGFGTVYHNGEIVSPRYEGSQTFELTLADGDVVKVFLVNDPEKYTLSFVMPEDTEGIEVLRDLKTVVSDFSTPSEAHEGTVYHLTVPNTEEYSATLGEEALTFDENNRAEFVPAADATLTVEKSSNSIENVAADAAYPCAVYNLQGILVLKSATAAEIEALPAGIYVAGGKKIVVK